MEEQPNNTKSMEADEPVTAPEPDSGGGGGGWGGWGFSPLSYLSDLQKAAEEISRNAVAVAQTAAKNIADIDNVSEESEPSKEENEVEHSAPEGQDEPEDEKRKSALEKLENASEDTLFSQGLKVFDDSVENFASGAWKAFGSALKGGSDFIQKLEHSAANIAESVQNGGTGSVAPSLLETGKAFTYKGIQALENVGKETMDILIAETGIEVDKKSDDHQGEEDHEEMSFDRCFYIYGGPEQLEELEALASHYTLLFNRRKAKLSSEQKSLYDGMLKQVQQILDLNSVTDGTIVASDKGKKTEIGGESSDIEMKNLHESSVNKAADMAAGFTSTLSGLAANDIVQRTTGRLESLHSEGVHRLSEICCFAVSQLFVLGKSIISTANKSQGENDDEDNIKIEWPEDSHEKAKNIRIKAQSMSESMEAVSNSFVTGISDVTEAYLAAIKGLTTADTLEAPLEKSVQDKASAYSEHLRADQTTAVGKIQDGLQYLCFVIVSTSMPSA